MHVHYTAATSSYEQPELMLGASRWFGVPAIGWPLEVYSWTPQACANTPFSHVSTSNSFHHTHTHKHYQPPTASVSFILLPSSPAGDPLPYVLHVMCFTPRLSSLICHCCLVLLSDINSRVSAQTPTKLSGASVR